MIRRSLLIVLVFIFVLPAWVFSQQAPQQTTPAPLRDFVGLVNQTYHPGIVAIFEKLKTDLTARGESNAVRAIDRILSGASGSGFVFNDENGNLYALTNYHVIVQANTISLTFERQDGTKRVFSDLTVIAADEEKDIALLAFAPGDRPLDEGLHFLSRPVIEGEDVYAAGFPGLGTTTIWQLSRGIISNANVRFPKSSIDDTLLGPFLQHTAQIDPGNSGGPLLIAQQNVPSGYVVAGLNTLS
jgi:serine protease Do